jgi:N-acetylmuramoyl-L-alanine amidase
VKSIAEVYGLKLKPVARPKPAPVVSAPKEEDEMLEKAIVINAFPDFAFAEILAARLKAPVYTRAGLPSGKVAKELYVVGGTKDGLVADKFVMLTGANRFDVAKAVNEFLN